MLASCEYVTVEIAHQAVLKDASCRQLQYNEGTSRNVTTRATRPHRRMTTKKVCMVLKAVMQ